MGTAVLENVNRHVDRGDFVDFSPPSGFLGREEQGGKKKEKCLTNLVWISYAPGIHPRYSLDTQDRYLVPNMISGPILSNSLVPMQLCQWVCIASCDGRAVGLLKVRKNLFP